MKKIVIVLMLILAAALGSIPVSANAPSPVVKANIRIDPANNYYIIAETAAFSYNYHMKELKIRGALFYPEDNDEIDKPFATCEASTNDPGEKIYCKVDHFRSNQNYKFVVRYTQFNDDGTVLQDIVTARWKAPPFGFLQDPLFFEPILKVKTLQTP